MHTRSNPTLVSRLVRPLLLAAFATGVAAMLGCASSSPPAGIVAVTPFDLQRYQGQWYELARLDHVFERGMSDVTATYTPQGDGSVRVLNRGFVTDSGKWRDRVGKARFTGAPNVGSLKVSFFGPFYGGYHVAALDSDYRWALVVGPTRSYCWVLARDKVLAPATKQAIVARAQALGIDTAALIWVSQEQTQPTEP